MFTGLIQCIGQISALTHKRSEATVTISADWDTYQNGESIAVNGACLSVTHFSSKQFTVFASKETLEITGLASLKNGTDVNLEKALTLSTPLGGHLVTGHVDTRVKLLERIDEAEAICFRFALPTNKELKYQIAPKGSISIDGVSLTVNTVTESYFEVMVIPITLAHTTLGTLAQGRLVNLETDIIAKYIARKIDGEKNESRSADISVDLLMRNGFMR